MKLKIKAVSPKIGTDIPAPFYATPGSAAMDLHACVDGPDFDGHLVDYDDAMRRGVMYRSFEGAAREAAEGRDCNGGTDGERKGA